MNTEADAITFLPRLVRQCSFGRDAGKECTRLAYWRSTDGATGFCLWCAKHRPRGPVAAALKLEHLGAAK